MSAVPRNMKAVLGCYYLGSSTILYYYKLYMKLHVAVLYISGILRHRFLKPGRLLSIGTPAVYYVYYYLLWYSDYQVGS